MKRLRAVWIAMTLAVVSGLGVGTAFAYWTSSGAGSGTAGANSLQTVTVAAFVGGDSPASSLLPAGPAGEVILRLSNPNAFAVTLVSVVGNGTITADSGHSGCSTTGVSFTNQTGLSVSVPAGSSLVRLPAAASMSTASLNACQGATFHIPVTITVHK